AIAAEVGQLAKLAVRAAGDPLSRFQSEYSPQVRFCLLTPIERDTRGAAFEIPERLLAEHVRTVVRGQPLQPVIEQPFCVGGPSGAQRRGAGLEPQDPVSRERLLELPQYTKRVLVTLLTVVQKHKGEPRVSLTLALVTGGL